MSQHSLALPLISTVNNFLVVGSDVSNGKHSELYTSGTLKMAATWKVYTNVNFY